MTKHETMMRRIETHGRELLAIFPQATEQDPVKLCKRLRRHESEANANATAMCNGDLQQDEYDRRAAATMQRVNAMLHTDRVWINGDPRGYALKIDLAPGEKLHQDWGGYGIIAPDLTENS